jgi:hypothetical protein
MGNLRALILEDGHFSKSPKHLPNSLRVLKWWKYPTLDLPNDFYPKKLAICYIYCTYKSLHCEGFPEKASAKNLFLISYINK